MFKKYVDNNNKTGRGRREFEYAEAMEDILDKKRNIHPVVLFIRTQLFIQQHSRTLSSVFPIFLYTIDLLARLRVAIGKSIKPATTGDVEAVAGANRDICHRQVASHGPTPPIKTLTTPNRLSAPPSERAT
ncbi:unnamed protein product [Acanthoscelides obtectus]|uniref:Uncharacterized protein n=1 Tax=Acanthoscelides obtectus TaxID=200917 RepID=A0A9P0MCG1_ACAOB|nr:unnamed protein product [Acanthoscelides obtectus]CAK1646069.1 hypothetical protein AOBTE_LOCUS14434 [Acanthoscelides obtectus]